MRRIPYDNLDKGGAPNMSEYLGKRNIMVQIVCGWMLYSGRVFCFFHSGNNFLKKVLTEAEPVIIITL